MKFHATPLTGACLVELEKRGDERGFFARMFCEREFGEAGWPFSVVQLNNSVTSKAGTLRGFHYQLAPAAEIKLIRCVRGALYDVILDLRPDSPSYGKWFGAELSAENRSMMYVPRGCAHAFLTLADETEVVYLVSEPYSPENERGVRFDDQRFGVDWPLQPTEISAKDRSWPDFAPDFHGVERLRGLL